MVRGCYLYDRGSSKVRKSPITGELNSVRARTTVTTHTYGSGRLHVSEDGSTLMALVANDGVFVFPIGGDQAKDADEAKTPKSKVKIIDK
jgi:hypothetical protein